MLRNLWPVALIAFAALLAGCGGDDAPTYNLAAFQSCMTDRDVVTVRLSEALAAEPDANPDSRLPTIAGRFPKVIFTTPSEGEVALIYIGPAADEFHAFADDLMAADATGELSQTGNFVVVTGPHPTRGFVDDMEACRGDALET